MFTKSNNCLKKFIDLYRIRDLFIASVLLIILLPLMLLSALLIKLLMPGPIFFVQQRIGRYGKPFSIYKFRSMVINSEENGITLSKDKRITPLGRILRKYKIDEFPQLINIVKGDMSLVGPRPDLPGYYDTLEGDYRKILNLRPGLTGLDSVVYPYEEDILQDVEDPVDFYKQVLWPHKVKINFYYLQHRSFIFDIKILLNTFSLLFFRRRIFDFSALSSELKPLK
ncbi:MAG: sugar transferase [Bacteroidales bacterium]